MKIAGCNFRANKIQDHTSNLFEATYKGKRFYISTDHGFEKPKDGCLKRYLIDVIDIKTGMYDVQTYKDLTSIAAAIIYALKGTMLIPKN